MSDTHKVGPADAFEEFMEPLVGEHAPGDVPRIVIFVPGIEGFQTVAELLQRAGAEITDERRTFEVKGSLTVDQAAALMRLAMYRDNNEEGHQLEFRFEGVACDRLPDAEFWWAQQQQLQAKRRRAGL